MAFGVACLGTRAQHASSALIPVGVARRDITPTNAVLLMGYVARAQLPAPTNVAQRIYVRALAFGGAEDASVMLTVDNCILPGSITEEIRGRLARRLKIGPERVAILVTHTHSAPCLAGAAPNIFARDLKPDEQEGIEIYTRFFVDRLEEAAVAALADRQPARLAWGKGAVGFAKNRRTAGGPVDHDLPLLRVSSPDGRLRAVLVSYACHCTTLGGELNAVHGDWAGVAALAFERDHPDSVALVAIGCGADSNPDPRGTIELVDRHGESLAAEANRLAALPLVELTQAPTARLKTISLPFEPAFTREQWESRATNSGIVGYHARRWLARLDRGESIPTSLPYPVQVWSFGDQLAMVFLGGEVVVDYSLRLKRELDPNRIWINAYANDVPCYIPSRRILREGGYEAESSLWYYDRPQRLAPALEDEIIRTVRELIPKSFEANPREADFPPPKSPDEALRAFRLAPEWRIECVAAEPLIESPVAIDFGMDGRLWVCEMRDYPSGLDGHGQPGGRIKVLRDTQGTGRFDQAEIVADGLPFPTGLMAWKEGVLVCAAPDLWWFRPDPSAKSGWSGTRLFSGFATHNFQARVNGLRWGLDGWVYGSGGLFGGTIQVTATGKTFESRNRDFRFHPETGEFEPLAGVSQQGRVRDDFGQAFGNDNSTLLFHFPLLDTYSRSNSYVSAPAARVTVPSDGDIGRVYPASRTLARFNDPGQANRLTSACGLEIYRDPGTAPALAGDLFVCEPVHNLVRRAHLDPAGISFRARRDPQEQQSEFLASQDNWFRPVEARTGPDGGLWVVDMYRFVVEHPRWIPPDRLRELDVRAGADRGRIWRVRPATLPLRPIRNWTLASGAELVEGLGSANGVERDLVHRRLLEVTTNAASLSPLVERLAQTTTNAASRVQALALLAQWNALTPDGLRRALHDADPRVQRFALTLADTRPGMGPEVGTLTASRAPGVAFQAWLTLSTLPPTEVASELRQRDVEWSDPWMRTAWLLASRADPGASFRRLDQSTAWRDPAVTSEALAVLLAEMMGDRRIDDVRFAVERLVPTGSESPSTESLWAVLRLQAALLRFPDVTEQVRGAAGSPGALALQRAERDRMTWVQTALDQRGQGANSGMAAAAAMEVLGLVAATDPSARGILVRLLDETESESERAAVLAALGQQNAPELAPELLAQWNQLSPRQRADRITLLLSREPWAEALLKAVETQVVSPAELSPSQRQRLRQHSSEAVRQLATQLLGETATDRSAVVSRFQTAAMNPGNAERGAAHFDRLCASCHALRGHGHAVGPDLTTFRSKPASDFVTAIFDPNAAIEPRFAAWTATLKDGRSLTGVVREERSGSLQLVEPGGAVTTIQRSDLDRLSPAALSLMPEGLESGLEGSDVADLLAWLKSGPVEFGQATPEQMAAARDAFRAKAPSLIEGWQGTVEPLSYPGWLGVLPLHFCRLNAEAPRLRWRARSADGHFRFPAAMGFLSQPRGPFVLLIQGRGALRFEPVLEDTTWRGSDGAVAMRYRVEEKSQEDSCGELELELGPAWRGVDGMVEFEVRGEDVGSQRWFGLYEWRP